MASRGTLIAAVILAAAFTSSRPGTADASGLFEPWISHPLGAGAEAVSVGDVNGDGLDDVVVTTAFGDDRLHVLLQNDLGGLDEAISYGAGNGNSVDVGDLNGDGRNDVVTSSSGAVGVLLQDVTGALSPAVSYATAASHAVEKVRVADFNGDGRADVAAIHWGSASHDVNVFLQTDTGALAAPVVYGVLHGGYDDLEAGDVNGDGRDDLVVMSGQLYAYDNFGVLAQNANGAFDAAVYYDLGGNELTQGTGVGDVNGDGLGDIVVSYGGNRPAASIGMFLQNSAATLDPAVTAESYDVPEPVEVADVDLDGRNDVVVLHGGWMRAGVYRQTEDGTLAAEDLFPIPYASHYDPHGLAVGDVNGDGANDVVIADSNEGLVVLLHAPPPTATPTSTPEPTATPTATATSTPTPTSTVTPTATPTPKGKNGGKKTPTPRR